LASIFCNAGACVVETISKSRDSFAIVGQLSCSAGDAKKIVDSQQVDEIVLSGKRCCLPAGRREGLPYKKERVL